MRCSAAGRGPAGGSRTGAERCRGSTMPKMAASASVDPARGAEKSLRCLTHAASPRAPSAARAGRSRTVPGTRSSPSRAARSAPRPRRSGPTRARARCGSTRGGRPELAPVQHDAAGADLDVQHAVGSSGPSGSARIDTRNVLPVWLTIPKPPSAWTPGSIPIVRLTKAPPVGFTDSSPVACEITATSAPAWPVPRGIRQPTSASAITAYPRKNPHPRASVMPQDGVFLGTGYWFLASQVNECAPVASGDAPPFALLLSSSVSVNR